eukprot:5258177-Pyramimonas_sp.AAC.1
MLIIRICCGPTDCRLGGGAGNEAGAKSGRRMDGCLRTSPMPGKYHAGHSKSTQQSKAGSFVGM